MTYVAAPSSQCEGKVAYDTYAEARDRSSVNNNVYRCPHCRMWHSGRSMKSLTRGGASHQLFAGFDDDSRNDVQQQKD